MTKYGHKLAMFVQIWVNSQRDHSVTVLTQRGSAQHFINLTLALLILHVVLLPLLFPQVLTPHLMTILRRQVHVRSISQIYVSQEFVFQALFG